MGAMASTTPCLEASKSHPAASLGYMSLRREPLQECINKYNQHRTFTSKKLMHTRYLYVYNHIHSTPINKYIEDMRIDI